MGYGVEVAVCGSSLNGERERHVLREQGVLSGEDDGQVSCRRIRDIVAGED